MSENKEDLNQDNTSMTGWEQKLKEKEKTDLSFTEKM